MYAVEVRDHIMIAHSFRGELFGPAQAIHGATFVVDVAFFRDELTADGVVVDIGHAHEVLKQTLAPLNYKNLDDLPQFAGQNTTTEFLARHIFDALAEAARSGRLGAGSDGVARIRVTLHESHVARAWYEAAVTRA
jgi:6-pyruvoyl-tetrahydropterin synthase